MLDEAILNLLVREVLSDKFSKEQKKVRKLTIRISKRGSSRKKE